MSSEQQVPLKYTKIEPNNLHRQDIILHEGGLWQCVLKNATIFINLQDKSQKEINQDWYLRVNKLQLIPKQWKFVGEKIRLKGQEVGLGPLFDIEVEGIRKFQELQIIKDKNEKGKFVDYKVVVLETHVKQKYLLVAIQFL